MRLIKDLDPLVKLGGAVVGAVVFLFTTFATVKYVDEKAAMANDSNERSFRETRALLLEIRDSVKSLEMQRVYGPDRMPARYGRASGN